MRVVEYPLGRRSAARNANKRTLGPAADFERDCGYFGRVEKARGIVVWKKGKKTRNFILFGSETVPPVAISIIDYRAGAENLLHTHGILARHAHDHIRKFGKAKRLLHDWTHGHTACVIFREAHRDGFRERHPICRERILSPASRG